MGLAIRSSGAVYTFGCLVLPGLVARSLCRETRPVLLVAPLLATAASGAAFVVAHGLDWPPAHTAVALLCGGVALAWAIVLLEESGHEHHAPAPHAHGDGYDHAHTHEHSNETN